MRVRWADVVIVVGHRVSGLVGQILDDQRDHHVRVSQIDSNEPRHGLCLPQGASVAEVRVLAGEVRSCHLGPVRNAKERQLGDRQGLLLARIVREGPRILQPFVIEAQDTDLSTRNGDEVDLFSKVICIVEGGDTVVRLGEHVQDLKGPWEVWHHLLIARISKERVIAITCGISEAGSMTGASGLARAEGRAKHAIVIRIARASAISRTRAAPEAIELATRGTTRNHLEIRNIFSFNKN